MTAEDFAYWIQGALEMNPQMLKEGMTPEQVQTIQDHLDLVFDKVTPDRINKPRERQRNNSGSSVKCASKKKLCKKKRVLKPDIDKSAEDLFPPFLDFPTGGHKDGTGNILIC